MTLNRRHLVAPASAAWLPQASAQSATWPARPIRLAQDLGQPLVIEHKPGAGGNIGAAEATRATPDGHTLLMASPPLTISPTLYPFLPYRPEQIAPAGIVGRVSNVLPGSVQRRGFKTWRICRSARAAGCWHHPELKGRRWQRPLD